MGVVSERDVGSGTYGALKSVFELKSMYQIDKKIFKLKKGKQNLRIKSQTTKQENICDKHKS